MLRSLYALDRPANSTTLLADTLGSAEFSSRMMTNAIASSPRGGVLAFTSLRGLRKRRGEF